MRQPRQRRTPITAEMIALYARGCELRDAGHGNSAEFVEIARKLEWRLLGRAPHEVSVFENLDGGPPLYMQARNTPAFPDFNGWHSGRVLQQELQAALDVRRRGIRETRG